MNRFKCPACGGNQYTACDTLQECIYCGHKNVDIINSPYCPHREKEDWRDCYDKAWDYYKREPGVS